VGAVYLGFLFLAIDFLEHLFRDMQAVHSDRPAAAVGQVDYRSMKLGVLTLNPSPT